MAPTSSDNPMRGVPIPPVECSRCDGDAHYAESHRDWTRYECDDCGAARVVPLDQEQEGR